MKKNPLNPLYQGKESIPSLDKGRGRGGILQQLSQRAITSLQKNFTVPQRYGTAFHITPPATDVRHLKTSVRATVADTAGWKNLSSVDQTRLANIDLTDVYLAWQLANPKQTAIKLMHLPENATAQLTIKTPGLYWIMLEPGATLTLEDYLPPAAVTIHRVFAWQKAGSQFNFFGLRAGSAFLNEKIAVELLEPEAKATVTHLTVGRKKEQADIAVSTYHRAPRTKSRMNVRSAAADSSATIYRGLIDVDQTARGIEGYQAGRSLLLSRTAVADALPRLEIRTNDVRCSHGVTTAHLDDLALHYIRSRGLPEPVARSLAITGFFHHQLPLPKSVATRLNKKLASL